ETGCPPLWPAARINTLLWMAETGFGHGAAIETEADEDAKFVYRMMCEDVGAIDVDAMMTALKDRVTLMREWERFLRQFPVLLCPVSGELPFAQQLDVRSEADFEQVFRAQLTQRALPVMGMPALAVATAADGGPPMGVQLVSGRFREDILFAAARVIEAAGPAPDVAEPTWGSVPVEAPRGAP
ncbi:MAG: amidase, partial [Pseudomonadota bacterium]